jgi:hypothetical protein
MDEAERQRRETIVIEENAGVLPYMEVMYLASVIYAAEAAIVAYQRYVRAREQEDGDSAAASAIHEALGHAAGLSRFFWPSGGKLPKVRAKYLRNRLAVEGDSPLRNRRLRDALEHFDERLDEFLLADCVGLLLPEPMVADVNQVDDPTAQIFKLVDPWNGVFVVLNERFAFQAIIEEVARILARAYDIYNGTSCAEPAG